MICFLIQPNDGDPAFHAALDRYRDKVVVSANFDFQNGVQAITPNDTLIPPPQLQDNRVGFVNFWPDAIDGKTRAATYRVTNRQLAGLPPQPGDEIYESLAARALAKIGHANDVPDDFRGHMIRFTAPDAFSRARCMKYSIQSSGMRIMPMARFLKTRS